jgi:hypothetical protein
VPECGMAFGRCEKSAAGSCKIWDCRKVKGGWSLLIHRAYIMQRYMSHPGLARDIRSCFTGLYPLDGSEEGNTALKLAMSNPRKYVMKPQREGGGRCVLQLS